MTDAVPSSPIRDGSPSDTPILAPDVTVAQIGDLAAGALTRHASRRWWAALAGSLALVLLALCLRLAVQAGTDEFAARARAHPLDGAGSDWWLAIASGSLIFAALLHLVGAEWRCAVGRVPELVALLGVSVAILDPLVQPGRIGLFAELYALEGTDLPARIRLALASDSAAIVASFIVAASFLAVRLLPDLAALRGSDPVRAAPVSRASALLSRGWQGSVPQWQRWDAASRSIALLGILVVLALQTDAALRVAAGGRATGAIIPVLLLVSAVLAGAGMTAALLAPLRAAYGLGALITARHFDILARIILVLGLASLYCHLTWIASILLDGDASEQARLAGQFTGGRGVAFWSFVLLAIVPSQLLWSDRVRRSGTTVALIGGLATLGVLGERVGLALAAPGAETLDSGAATALAHLLATILGALGLFLAMLLLALRVVPIVPIGETRRLALSRNPEALATAARPVPNSRPGAGPVAGVVAVFGTEAALAAGIRALAQRHPGIPLAAYGPAPMPLAAEALRSDERLVRAAALTGALAGGLAQFALSLIGAGQLPALDGSADALPAWPYLVGPSVCIAAMTGSLAAAFALLAPILLERRAQAGVAGRDGAKARMAEGFVLAADLRGQEMRADRVEQVLASLPEGNARPRTLRRVPA